MHDERVDLAPYRTAGIPERLAPVLGVRPVESVVLLGAPVLSVALIALVAWLAGLQPLAALIVSVVWSVPVAMSAAEFGAVGWIWSRWSRDAIVLTDVFVDVARLASRDSARVLSGTTIDAEALVPLLRSWLQEVLRPLMREAIADQRGVFGLIAELQLWLLVRTVDRALPRAVHALLADPARRRATATDVGFIARQLEADLTRLRHILVRFEKRMTTVRTLLLIGGALVMLLAALLPIVVLASFSG